MRDIRLFIGIVASGFICSTGSTASAAHPVVPGFERFYLADQANLAEGGQLLLGELNCLSCHKPDGAVAIKQAPILDHVGSRVRTSFLSKFLNDPQAVKPGTTMPNLFAGDNDKAVKIEALVHFLASTGQLRHERAEPKAAALGKEIYAKIGCVACHGPRDAGGLSLNNLPSYMVPLGDLKAKYSITSLTAFLENPLQTRPSGRMPHLLVAKDARDVANYLLQGVKVDLPMGVGTTGFSYYEGNWTKLPDFKKQKPKASGVGAAFDLTAAKRGENYALVFDGYFKVLNEGQHKFFLTSDDGSKLLIDDKLVVNNDGIHPPQEVTGSAFLAKGNHAVRIEFFNGGSGAELQVDIQGNGLVRQPLGALVAAAEATLDQKTPTKKISEDDELFEIKPGLVEKGKALFASIGCANCHQMSVNKKPIKPLLSAPNLVKLKPGGCTADQPTAGVPDYRLSVPQKAALEAALKSAPVESKEPAAVVARTMTTLNCYACHSRDKRGGPTEETSKYFLTVQPEMGDEGRVPPPLDGVGAKLNPGYFNQILDKGAHDRPYMHTQMPGFGAANVGHLQAIFAQIDKVPPTPTVEFAVPMSKVYSTARHMVGEQALACIKCHTFNGVKAEGIQGIDMAIMPKRVTRDWFHYYMLDPQKVRPGTRMPSAFLNNMSPFPNLLDGQAVTQIESIWAYLGQGKDATLPLGMGKKSIPLRPYQEAIIYRNFIKGAGVRAIGVGYPEKISLAFDANDMRLALIWQGAFIDAATHWEGRGQGFEGPLGDNVLSLPTGAPFAVLEKTDSPWPTAPAKDQGYKFIGYRLTPDERPTFNYSFGGIKVEDFPNATIVGNEATLKRTMKLAATEPVQNLYYRAATGVKIEAAADGWYKIDGWKMKIDSAVVPQIRQVGGKSELLVPVLFKDGKAEIVQEFVW